MSVLGECGSPTSIGEVDIPAGHTVKAADLFSAPHR
jgi:hypothetical protein